MSTLPRIHRMTKQRQIILDVLQNTESHPTADWIYEKVRQEVPRISLGTVYRNLRVLKEMGDIQELNYGSTYSRFDGRTKPHYHFVCLECGDIQDILVPTYTELDKEAATETGGNVEFHRLEFYGTCSGCKL